MKRLAVVIFLLLFSLNILSFAQEEAGSVEEAAVEPSGPAEVAEPNEPIEASEPAEPSKPTEPAEPVEPAEPTEPAEPVEPAEPAEPIEPAEISEEIEEPIWINDELPEGAQTTGEWIWSKDAVLNGELSHTDGFARGLHQHGFRISTPIKLTKDSKIIQYVWLDSEDTPGGIMIKLLLEDEEELDLYWEGEEEVFVDTVEYLEAWYMGFLPKAGEWKRLDIKMRELDIKEVELCGIVFITFNGKSYWDSTTLEIQETGGE